MIPENIDLFERLTSNQIKTILLTPTKYFKLVEEYTNLQKVFETTTIFETVSLWFEMLISPLLTIGQSILKQSIQIMSIMSLQKSVQLWKDWFRWKELQNIMREWVKIVRAIGGPFIATNDATYHMYVYADAMQRIYEGLTLSLITKKCTKRLK